jgi:uncharacterized protein
LSTNPFSRSNITLPRDRINALCEKYRVEELSVFGSVLREDFGPECDIDFLVVFRDDDVGPWMSKVLDLEKDLSTLLGRKVDLVMKGGIEQSSNLVNRRAILDTAQVIYPCQSVPAPARDSAYRVSIGPGPMRSDVPPLVLARIRLDPERVAEFCRRNHIRRLSLFGSVLRDDFNPESDVDVLVEFEPGRAPAWEFFGMQDELTTLFGRRVDLNTPGFLSRYFRDQVQAEAQTLYDSQSEVDRQGSAAAHA